MEPPFSGDGERVEASEEATIASAMRLIACSLVSPGSGPVRVGSKGARTWAACVFRGGGKMGLGRGAWSISGFVVEGAGAWLLMLWGG